MDRKELDTPQVIVDLNILEKNIREMQAYCDQHGFRFRPHIKTHKIPEIAHMQLRAGAVGITCQKIGEAEIMAEAGIDDILIYYNIIGSKKLDRLMRLAKQIRLSVVVDSPAVLKELAAAAEANDCRLGVLIDCDTGFHRTGVQTPEEALLLAQEIESSDHLYFVGLGTFPFREESAEWFRQAQALFAAQGLPIPSISGGSSASPQFAHRVGTVTELRAGTYVFHDWSCVQTGIATLENCAERILSTVVNRPTETLGIVDAGSKTLSSDSGYLKPGSGYGYILEYPQAQIYALSEEHGHVDFSACDRKPQIGEVITIIPNHACGTMNMHDEVWGMRDGELETVWRVAARGKVR